MTGITRSIYSISTPLTPQLPYPRTKTKTGPKIHSNQANLESKQQIHNPSIQIPARLGAFAPVAQGLHEPLRLGTSGFYGSRSLIGS